MLPLTKFFIHLFLIFLGLTNHISLALETSDKPNHSLISQINQLVDQRELKPAIFKKALETNNRQTIIATLKGLGRIGGQPTLPLITPYMNNKEEAIRRAAIFSLGISANRQANAALWKRLAIETSDIVKQEIYLALGNLGQNGLVTRVIENLHLEQSQTVQSTMFQALAMTLTFHSEIKHDYSQINFDNLLTMIEKDDLLSGRVLYFLARIKHVGKYIKIAQLPKLTSKIHSIQNKKTLARLIGRVVTEAHYANRKILSWLIIQSEQTDKGLATESIRSMGNFINIPQARIQLGKLHASSNTLIAQTALRSLANSALDGKRVIKLLKEQLKSKNAGMVVIAMAGLIERQKREDMTWALKILAHENAYVKNNFARLIYEKDKHGFKNVLKMLSQDPDERVSKPVRALLNKNDKTDSSKSEKTQTSSFLTAIKATKKQIIFTTTQGNITIQLLSEAPYTSLNFVALVKAGFYNGSYFNRVIGNFVTQGGDPIGDGEGGSQQTIREEISYLSHIPRTVGMATSGKDTGDSQFFFNTSDNIHLARNYTVFATVIDGWENVLALSNGDQILKAEINE